MSITKASLIDLNGQELILDADADTSITADTDDQIDIKIAGSDSIRIKANEIENVSGDFTLDVAGDITLDAGGGDLVFADDGTTIGAFVNSSTNLVIKSTVSDSDLLFQGNDGGSIITALTLDMSDAGTATFNSHVRLGDSKTLSLGAGFDIEITSDGTNGTIATPNGILLLDSSSSIRLDADSGEIDLRDGGTDFGQFAKSSNDFRINHSIQDGSIVFRGNDGGSVIAAMTISMADAGKVTTNGDIAPGGNVIMPSGSGISFAANSSTSATGASMTSELLDHYEEGTFTPYFSSTATITHDIQTGRYTRIGDRLIFDILLGTDAVTSISTGANVYIYGLPYAADGSQGGAISLSYAWNTALDNGVTWQIGNGDAYINLYQANNQATLVKASFFGTGGNNNRLWITGQYRV